LKGGRLHQNVGREEDSDSKFLRGKREGEKFMGQKGGVGAAGTAAKERREICSGRPWEGERDV